MLESMQESLPIDVLVVHPLSAGFAVSTAR